MRNINSLRVIIISAFCLFLFCSAIDESSPHPSSLATSSKNIVEILQKAGGFSSLLRLLKATQMDVRINSEIRKSDQGLTIFAPSDAAFSALQPGTLNTLSNEQQVQLVQFHVLTSYLSPSQFATATNPLHTQAGSSADGQFALNVTTDGGGGHVNLTSGVVNATLADNVFSDGHLAVYHVDKVLLPQLIFAPAPPAPAPAPEKPKKKKKAKESSPPPASALAVSPPPEKSTAAASSNTPKVEASSGVVVKSSSLVVGIGGALLAAFCNF